MLGNEQIQDQLGLNIEQKKQLHDIADGLRMDHQKLDGELPLLENEEKMKDASWKSSGNGRTPVANRLKRRSRFGNYINLGDSCFFKWASLRLMILSAL